MDSGKVDLVFKFVPTNYTLNGKAFRVNQNVSLHVRCRTGGVTHWLKALTALRGPAFSS